MRSWLRQRYHDARVEVQFGPAIVIAGLQSMSIAQFLKIPSEGVPAFSEQHQPVYCGLPARLSGASKAAPR